MINEFLKGIEVVAGVIVENKKGEILLTKSNKWNNKWTLAGGHIEPGESIAEGAIREAKEEIGLNLEFIDIIHFGELINSKDFYRPVHFIYFDIYCKCIGKEDPTLNHEYQEYQWVTPESALKLDLAESFEETIKKLIKYKKI